MQTLGIDVMAPTIPIEYTGQKESKRFLQKGLAAMIGKSRKVSKGYTSGFVPDYRHAVETTMGESEGFGSSGRVETEMALSEDSSAPKRKCISLNVDSCEVLDVPMQVLSLSKMSGSEHKDLVNRLKLELDQVRVLQRKIASFSSEAVVSPASDIRSCNDGHRGPPFEDLQSSFGASTAQGKKRPHSGHNGSHTKRSLSGKLQAARQAPPPSTSVEMLMKQCETLLKRLMTHQYAWVFNTPVDVVKLNLPDYFTVIKHPMDLGTIKTKMASGEYSSPLGFVADVRLTFSNAKTYNPPGNDVYIMAETLSKYFEGRWKTIEKKFPTITNAESAPAKSDFYIKTENQLRTSEKKKMVEKKVKPDPVKRIMSEAEKQKLSTQLEELLGELPDNIIDFLKEQSFNAGQTSEDEIEIDIDALSGDTLFKLRKLLDDYLLEKQRTQAKAERCEMEVINESGFSNSSIQPCKGNDHIEEDVDIGGNDLPVSSYPHVEIEKDAAQRNSKRSSSSSSSSSESGSSSSDSESGSSSGAESEGAKVSVPGTTMKEARTSGVSLDTNRNILGDSGTINESLGELGEGEQGTRSMQVSVEGDGHQEGESAPSERQVSPEKRYRAALLIGRFADTILKAREKTLAKDDKQDPEKLRLPREELERRQKEEKARLQAEAKAAEEAHRKAEEEAAAEAKRKRELEREAARQALLKIEKTVEINENCQFMEDLEMLRTAPPEDLPSFVDHETSPEHSENGLGSFKLKGSNPLEQLGLYMKVDDEEEEEIEPQSVAGAVHDDVEEGEI